MTMQAGLCYDSAVCQKSTPAAGANGAEALWPDFGRLQHPQLIGFDSDKLLNFGTKCSPEPYIFSHIFYNNPEHLSTEIVKAFVSRWKYGEIGFGYLFAVISFRLNSFFSLSYRGGPVQAQFHRCLCDSQKYFAICVRKHFANSPACQKQTKFDSFLKKNGCSCVCARLRFINLYS